MFKKIAVVFPGQGSQASGMLKAMAEHYALVRETFQEASSALNYNLWDIIQSDNVETLNQTAVTQPALLAASIALWRIWQAQGGPSPLVMAGHSLGEYSALVIAEALSFREAVQLVAERGRYMQEAVPEGAGGMAAIIGLSAEEVNIICAAAAQGEVVAPANINGQLQIVIAGHLLAVERAMAAAKTAGAKLVKWLEVSVPSHCALMKSAAERLEALCEKMDWRSPQLPIVQNVDAKVHCELADMKQALYRQLAEPVRWVECMESMVRDYTIDVIIECGPGKILSGLNKRIVAVPTFSIAEPEQLKEALAYVQA